MKDLIPLVLVLTAISAIAALGLALVYDMTAEPIQLAEAAKFRKALTDVLPGMVNDSEDVSFWYPAKPDKDQQKTEGFGENYFFFRGFDQDGKLIGIAFIVANNEGYGGEVKTLVGLSPDGHIINYKMIKFAETPGLGTKANTDGEQNPPVGYERPAGDKKFRNQFFGAGLDNKTFYVKKDNAGSADKPSFDSITGATITSRAVITPLRAGLEYFAANKDKILGVTAPVEAPVEEPVAEEADPAMEGGDEQ